MKRICLLVLVTLLATTLGVAPVGVSADTGASTDIAFTAGAGHYLVAGSIDVAFGFVALQENNGRVSGFFHESTNDGLGLVQFDAAVTCLSVDPDLGRAWIGGIIIANSSTSPDFTDTIHQPGHNIWFRVLDSRNPGDQDRRAFMGFEGAIPDSATYC